MVEVPLNQVRQFLIALDTHLDGILSLDEIIDSDTDQIIGYSIDMFALYDFLRANKYKGQALPNNLICVAYISF